MQEKENVQHVKIVLTGESGVGKTSLISQYANHKFNDYSIPTYNGCNTTKEIVYRENKLRYNIWDTAGQERFKSISNFYYRGAEVAIVVYDITDLNSFNEVDYWVKSIKNANSKNVVFIIAGNKCDKENERKITKKQGEEYANNVGALFFEVSAKTGENVQEMFEAIAPHVFILPEDLPNSTSTSKIHLEKTPTANVPEDESTCC